MTTTPAAVLNTLAADRPAALDRLLKLLAIPSVSTDPERKGDVECAAGFLADQLRELGLRTRIEPTAGHPVVLADSADLSPADAPQVLFYGHYDVQPAEPLDLWTNPPFTPTVRDGAIFARGASDDKGPVQAFLEALRAWRHSGDGKLPVRLIVMLEGEEEIGSPHLPALLAAHRAELAGPAGRSVVLVSDTGMWDAQTPAITYGLRGLLYLDLQLHALSRDVHSGIYGGIIPNPAVELTAVLGRLFDAQHRVTIPGFYDDVAAVTPAERRAWDALHFDPTEPLREIGAPQEYGEAGFDTLTRRWARPSCDLNGLYGGYGGPGGKTIIPAFAGAKLSFRLAPNQNAARIEQAVRAWLTAQDVHGCTWKISSHGACDSVMVATDSPFIAAARRALEQAAGRAPVLMREGATIPIITAFKQVLGLDSILAGFGLAEDRVHSPNEKWDVSRYELAARSHALLLAELAKV